jgi:diguanylate cyclase (GGDEF)-like protein
LDIITLMAAGSFVAALSGILLTGAWTQMRGEPALLWWAAAKFAFAVGVGLLSVGAATSSVMMLAVGGLVTAAAPAFLWAGTRTFVHRRVSWLFLLGGTIIWFIAAGIPFRGGPQEATTIVGFAAWIVYLSASNWELWRGRAERLTARWPLMALLTVHGVIFVGGIYDVVFQQMLAQPEPPITSWFGLIYFEGIVYAVGSAIFMIVMSHERSEGSHIRAAQTDALTGVAGRGAFFLGAERLLARCRTENIPISVVVFDLDRFKSINDKHGHAMGDRVLRIFADTARGVLRPDDFLGRHGGEEFAVVLPGTSLDVAYVVADRVRSAFADACRKVDGAELYSTVSAGVAAAKLTANFSAALEKADQALYRAKNRGRNRVERLDPDRQDGSNVIRVA